MLQVGKVLRCIFATDPLFFRITGYALIPSDELFPYSHGMETKTGLEYLQICCQLWRKLCFVLIFNCLKGNLWKIPGIAKRLCSDALR